MAANDFAAQNGTEKLSTHALTTVNGTNVTADLIEVQRMKPGYGVDGDFRDVSYDFPFPVTELNSGLVSTANSSAVVLLLGGTLTGTGEDVSHYSLITVSVFSSHASAVDGLQLQQSSNNIDWDFVDSYSIPAATGKTFSAAVAAKFFRVVFTNGGVMQTAFRLQTIYSKQDKKPSSVRPQNNRSPENDFVEVLSYLMGYNGAAWDMIKARNGRLGVDTDSARLASFNGQSSSFRIPGRAGTAGQKLFTIHNATGSAVLVDVEKINIDTVATVAKAVTVLPPAIRIYRITALPTGGTASAKVTRDTGQSSGASVTLLGDASADGTSSATALAATLVGGATSQIFAPRLITGAGYEIVDRIEFMNDADEKITLRPGEGLCVVLDYVLATQNPITDMWLVGCKWTEYTAV